MNNINITHLKKLLLESNSISEEMLRLALNEAETSQIPLEIALVQNGHISEQKLGRLIANNLNVKFIDLDSEAVDNNALFVIPEEVAAKQSVIAFKQDDQDLHVATSNISNHEEWAFLKKKTGKNIVICYATPQSVVRALKHYRNGIQARAAEILASINEAPADHQLETDYNDAIIRLVDLLLEFAHANNASDIHIEPMKKDVVIRCRIDGSLTRVLTYPRLLHDKVVSRIKILSRLSIDEHAAAQDGHFSYKQKDAGCDVRVSIMPTTAGENVVMRLLSENSYRLFIDDIGLNKKDLHRITAELKKPFGMILTVGPTGAGKTTTLYSLLHVLDRADVNIMTIEDPVEYEVESLRQIQVNAKKQITFASGLRAIVRQDPDIIMVGEIRDRETAAIGINAAMTGHLVLSSLHSNDAATTFPRLLEMGIAPFLLASSLNMIIAQRLVRKICEKCRLSQVCDDSAKSLIKDRPEILQCMRDITGREDCLDLRMYRGRGCENCNNTGYMGRTGIFEVLEVTPTIKSLLIKKAPVSALLEEAHQAGMTTMLHDGIDKVLRGITTIDEVILATNS